MKILKTLGLFILLAAFMISCENDNTDEIVPNDPNYQVDTIEVNPLARGLKTTSPNFINLDCIRIPFPVDFLQASGNTITVSTEDELESAYTLADSIVDFIYPFEVLDEDDNEFTIEEVKDLAIAIKSVSVTTIRKRMPAKRHLHMSYFSTTHSIFSPTTIMILKLNFHSA